MRSALWQNLSAEEVATVILYPLIAIQIHQRRLKYEVLATCACGRLRRRATTSFQMSKQGGCAFYRGQTPVGLILVFLDDIVG
jgi:hypothetical protein